ncbi:ABC transporter substrate-binding protein [Gemmatimonas sp.]|uniref:ABC transporter substrate-binding protein n=1 Tax=Gemmatimonas sp. TaxID=1962908 RepID=UPI00333F1789
MSRPVLRLRALVGSIALCATAAQTAACRDDSPAAERVQRASRGLGDVIVAAAWPWAAKKEIKYGEGLDLATAEVNGSGGIGGRTLRVVRHDDEESVNVGRMLAERLAADPDVVAVIGHLQSYVSVSTASTYEHAGLVMVAPTATDPALTEQGGSRIFRVTFTEHEVGRQMAQLALARSHRRIVIVYIRSRYGRGLANAFEESLSNGGGTIVARQSYDPVPGADDRVFVPILRDLKQLEFEAIFLAGEVPSATSFIVEARRSGITAPIYGGDAMSSPALLAGGEAAEGVIVATIFHPDDPRPEVRRFVEAFRAKYHTDPDVGSAAGYDAMRVLAEAMRYAKSSVPDSVALALREMPVWTGATGPFRFTARGELAERPLVMAVVRNGRFAFLDRDRKLAAASDGSQP